MKRFPAEDFDIPIDKNEAFLLKTSTLRTSFRQRYAATKALYYKGQPSFNAILDKIEKYLGHL